jgi:hypothetical protein
MSVELKVVTKPGGKVNTIYGVRFEHKHYEVYEGDTYLGYYMQNQKRSAEVGEHWNFTNKHTSVTYFYASSVEGILDTLRLMRSNKEVIVKRHCGIVVKLRSDKTIEYLEGM